MADRNKKKRKQQPEPSRPQPLEQGADEELLYKVEELVQAAREGFRDMRDEVAEIEQRYSTQESNLRDIQTTQTLQEKDIRRILTIVDGNGEKPLSVRLTRMEADIESVAEGLGRIGDQLSEISSDVKEQKKIWGQRVWEILKPLIAAALGAAAVATGSGAITL